MIIKSNNFNPQIMYDNYHMNTQPNNGVILRSFPIASINIKLEDIPEEFFMEELLEGSIIYNKNVPTKPKVIEYMIIINNYRLSFTDRGIANIYFEILCSDFENVDIKEIHPEIFL